MRRLIIIIAVFGTILYLSEITAFSQRGMRGGLDRRMHRPVIRERRAPEPRGRMKYGTERSGTRGSNGRVELNGRKSVSDHLTRNSKLSDKLQGLLGEGELYLSVEGFKNLGQFVAAVHVSNNLGISFDELKARMTESSPESLATSENLGTTESLGKAIRALRPDVNATKEIRKANRQASNDLEETPQ